jgi:hypothetical protein
MRPIPAPDFDLLRKLVSLQDSPYPGEREAAVAAATRLLDRHKLKWSKLLSLLEVQQQPTPRPEPDPACGWRGTAARCSRYPQLINKWEHDFLTGLPRFPRLSAKQRTALDKIAIRLRACGCEL